MNKRGRFVFGVVVTIALLASLMLTAATVAALPKLPDPGNPGPLLPPPVLATPTPTEVPEEEEDEEDDGDEDEDDGPGQPGATATPTPRATTPPAQGASPVTTRTTPTSRANSRGPCTLWTTASSNHGGSFPALSTPAGTVSATSVGALLAAGFSVNYGDGPFTLSAARNCTSVEEMYLTHGVTSTSDCPSDGYGPWRSAGTYCVRAIARGFWAQ